MKPLNDEMKKEITEITEIFLSLPKVDRLILLNNAIAFQTLRKIESNAKSRIRDNEKAGQEGKVKKILIRLLLRGRKRYLDIVWVKEKAYKVEIEEFIPAEKWVAKTKKALQNAEPNSKQVIFSIEEQQIPFFQ